MRWLLLLATLAAIALCMTRHSGGAMAIWLLVAVGGALATALAFAQARIEGGARAEHLSDYELERLRQGKPPLR